MPTKNESSLLIKANPGQFSIDEAQGIVECFVAGIGNKDSVGDIIQPGAFTESLKRRRPRVVWGHNWNDPIGKVLDIYEVGPNDPRLPAKMKAAGIGGLYAKVQFNLNTEKGREAFASVAFFGQDQEWSIGYKTLQATFDNQRQANLLREVELYECSPVLHGANQLTGTISVKNDPVFDDIDTMIDYLEHDDFDLSEKGQPLRDPKGGLTAAGRRHFARTEGANLKPGVKGPADTPEKMRRKGSFLTRFFTNPSGPMKKPNGKPSRLALSAAAWGEPVPQDRSDAAKLAAKGRRLLERYENSKKKDDFSDMEFSDFDAFEEEWSTEEEKCHAMGAMMPPEVRARWMQVAREEYEGDDDEEETWDIFGEGLATPLSPEKRNALLMEMSRRSQFPVEIVDATENSVVFHIMKNGQRMTFRTSYHYEGDEGRYMFGKPERVAMEFMPVRSKPVMAKPEVDPTQRMARPDDDDTMPRLLRIVEKFGEAEKSLLDDSVIDFLDVMEVDFKAGRVISSRNMSKLKNIVTLLQEVISSAGEVEQKDAMLIPCEIEAAFATKSLIDPIIEYHGAVAEVTESGIWVKSGATPEFREAIENATGSLAFKALGGRIGGGGGKGRRAARFATARFDPNAVDGDEDGLVQEGTPFERPATPRNVASRAAGAATSPTSPRAGSGMASSAGRQRSSEPGLEKNQVAGDMTLEEYGYLEDALSVIIRDSEALKISKRDADALEELRYAIDNAIMANDMIVMDRETMRRASDVIDNAVRASIEGGNPSVAQGRLLDVIDRIMAADENGLIWESINLQEAGTRLDMPSGGLASRSNWDRNKKLQRELDSIDWSKIKATFDEFNDSKTKPSVDAFVNFHLLMDDDPRPVDWRPIGSDLPFDLRTGKPRKRFYEMEVEAWEARQKEKAQRNKRLQAGKFDLRDRAYWEVTGDGVLQPRRNEKNEFVPSWEEDPKLNQIISDRFRRGDKVSSLAADNGVSSYEIRKMVIANTNRKKGAGLASSMSRGDGMVKRDERGRVIFEGSEFLADLAKKREDRLRELGFDDDEIETLLGYQPQERPLGFASRKNLHKNTVNYNTEALKQAYADIEKFRKDNPDFDPGKENWDDEDWTAKWEQFTDLEDEAQGIIDFYEEENQAWNDARQKSDDAKGDIDDILADLQGYAEELGTDRDALMASMEGLSLEAFNKLFASVDMDDAEKRSTYNLIKQAIDDVEEKRIDLYGAELDAQTFQRHGDDAVLSEIKAIAANQDAIRKQRNWGMDDRGGRRQSSWGGFASSTQGRGLGRSREIYPGNSGRKPSSAVSFVRYDAGNEELIVQYSSGQTYVFGGISAQNADALDSADSLGQALQRIKGSAAYTIKPNGDISGTKPTPGQHMSRDMKRLKSTRGLDGSEERIFQEAIDALNGDLDSMSDSDRRDAAQRMLDLMNNLMADGEYHSAELLQKASQVARPSRSMSGRVAAPSKLEVGLSADEIGDIRRGLASAIGSSNRDETKNRLRRYSELLGASKNNVLKMDAEEYDSAIDAFQAMDAEGVDYFKPARDVLEFAALSQSGKWTSRNVARSINRPDQPSGFASKRPNNGAPDDITQYMQDEFIYWARQQGSFRVVQELVRRFDRNNGELSPKDWVRLHNYYALYSKRGKGMPLYGTGPNALRSNDSPRGFRSEISSPDAPKVPSGPGRGRKVGSGEDKRFRGKKWEDLKPRDWDLMSAEEQEEELITSLHPDKSGLRKVDYDRLLLEIIERQLDDEESPRERRRRMAEESRKERMDSRRQAREAMSEDERAAEDARIEASSRRAGEKPQGSVEATREVTAADARAARKKIMSGLDKTINKDRDRIREDVDRGAADEMHAETWEEVLSLITETDDLTLSQLDSIRDVLDGYLDEANSLDELTTAESRSIRSARALLNRVEDLLEQFEDDRWIAAGTTEAGEKLGRGGDSFVDAVERAGFSSAIRPYKANISRYLNAREDAFNRGFASSTGKAGRAEVKGQATFFKDIQDSLPKEIREAEKAGDSATAKALRMLESTMKRQDSGKVGPTRTDAGQILLTRDDMDSIMDAIMVVIDRQMEIGGTDRLDSFVKLLDMLAKSGMATFIDKTVDEVGSRTVARTNSRGQTVNISSSE